MNKEETEEMEETVQEVEKEVAAVTLAGVEEQEGKGDKEELMAGKTEWME